MSGRKETGRPFSNGTYRRQVSETFAELPVSLEWRDGLVMPLLSAAGTVLYEGRVV